MLPGRNGSWNLGTAHCQPEINPEIHAGKKKINAHWHGPARADRQGKSRAWMWIGTGAELFHIQIHRGCSGLGTHQDGQREKQRDRTNCWWYLPSRGGILRPDCWNWCFPTLFSIKSVENKIQVFMFMNLQTELVLCTLSILPTHTECIKAMIPDCLGLCFTWP